jgi:hypothetical protein
MSLKASHCSLVKKYDFCSRWIFRLIVSIETLTYQTDEKYKHFICALEFGEDYSV